MRKFLAEREGRVSGAARGEVLVASAVGSSMRRGRPRASSQQATPQLVVPQVERPRGHVKEDYKVAPCLGAVQ